MSEEMQDNPALGEPQGDRRRNLIIGGIVVAVILAMGIPLLLLRGADEPTPDEPTPLELLQGEVTALGTRLGDVELKAATNSETAANLGTEVAAIPTTDWTSTFNGYASELDALESQVNSLSWPPYALVTRVDGEYVDITLYGVGDYPVMVTVFGETIGVIEPRYPANYTVTGSWAWNGTVSVAVEPVAEWGISDTIELKVSGVHYAQAVVGDGAVVITPDW